MVLGLAGAALPPRTRRAPPDSGACGRTSLPAVLQVPSMVRVRSSSGFVGLPAALHVGAGQSAADAVETPCGDAPQPLQPAASDHSQMLHGSDRCRMQREDAVNSGEQHQQQEAVHGGKQQEQQQEQQQGLQTSLAQLVSEALHQAEVRQQQAQQQPAVASAPAAAAVGRKRQGAKRAASEQQAQEVGGTRPQRTRLAAAAAGAATAACPSAKRRKTFASAGGGSSGGSGGGARVSSVQRHKNSQYADVLHRTVVVPGAVFYVDIPGQVYIGRVNKVESGRRVPSVEVQFQDDGARYWFPVADVRSWMAGMVANGCWQKYNTGIPPPDLHAAAAAAAAAAEGEAEEKAAAAQALQSLSVSMASSRRAGQAGSESVQQPAVSSRVQRRDSRAQQRGQSRHAGAGEGAAPMQLLANVAGAGSPPT